MKQADINLKFIIEKCGPLFQKFWINKSVSNFLRREKIQMWVDLNFYFTIFFLFRFYSTTDH